MKPGENVHSAQFSREEKIKTKSLKMFDTLGLHIYGLFKMSDAVDLRTTCHRGKEVEYIGRTWEPAGYRLVMISTLICLK